MAHIERIAQRLTHRYVDTCSHLDAWGDSMTFKFLQRKLVEEGNYHDDTGTYRVRVIGSKTADQELQRQMLRDHLSFSGCHHEYDCCGCRSASATVTKVRKGVFTALIRTGRNY